MGTERGLAATGYVLATSEGFVGWVETGQGVRRSTLPLGSVEEVEAQMDCRCEQVLPDERPIGAQLARFYETGGVDLLDIPLDLPAETPFQAAVREVVRHIPGGQTMSYGEVAKAAGRPGAARAVGRVMATNPVPPFVPCHRVIGSDGQLHGFGGGLDMKARWLSREGVV